MISWGCRFGFHDWIYIVSDVKVSVGRKYVKRADYKICTLCELVKDL